MRVMIVGAGKVGCALANQICNEGEDVIVVDKLHKRIENVTDAYDCNGYVGNGSNAEFLKKIGIDSTSLFIAVTGEDETNILCCSIAKKLGVKRTVAAVNSPEFDSQSVFFKDLGVDYFINLHKAAANTISHLISFEKELELESFLGGQVKIATITIEENSLLADVAIPDVQSTLGASVLICAISRKGKTHTPHGKHRINPGDKITFLAIGDEMNKALEALKISENELKKVVIVGGGKVGYYLAETLLTQKVKVTLIESDERRCRELMDIFPKANVLMGSGTDSEFMGTTLKGAQACIAVTRQDEDNLVIAMFAKALGTKHIAAEIDNKNFDVMLKKSGINHTFSTQTAAIDRIIRDIRSMSILDNIYDTNNIKKLHALNGGQVEAVEFEISNDFPYLNIPFKNPEFKTKNGILIAVIIRGSETIIPDGNSFIKEGDNIIVVSAEHKITKIADIFN